MAACSRERDCRGVRQWLVAAICSLLLSACMAPPHKGSFYQPLNIDSQWRDPDWQPRLEELQNLQISMLYLQWTRHDVSEFGGRDGWLWQLMGQASEKDFELVLGLYAESVFFDHINKNFDPDYWADFITKNQQWGAQLLGYLRSDPRLNVTAFFFPGELNDRVLADPDALARVSQDLSRLQQTLGKPLYVSVFYTGYLTATEYKQSLRALGSAQVKVLHQDGSGTQALNKNQVDELLAELDCEFVVIHELFVQRSLDNFDVLNSDLIRDKISQPGCHKRVFFSWRYMMPW